MNNTYCYVFDYSVAAIYEIKLTEEESNTDDINVEDLLDRRGLKLSDCYVMFTDKKLEIEPINLKQDVESI